MQSAARDRCATGISVRTGQNCCAVLDQNRARATDCRSKLIIGTRMIEDELTGAR